MAAINCKTCGTELPDEAKFCGVCGTPADNKDMEKSGPESNKCKSCGAELQDNTKFCGVCGTPADNAVAAKLEPGSDKTGTTVAKKEVNGVGKPNFIKFAVPAIIAVVALIAVIIAANVLKPAKYERAKGSIYITQVDDSVVIYPHGGGMVEIEGYIESTSYNSKSLNGTAAVVMVSESRGSYNNSGGHALYMVTDKAQLIADGVYGCFLSVSGNAVVYITNYDSFDNTAELWLYSGGKKTSVAKDWIINSYSRNICVSPDGKAVAYTNYDDGKYTGFVWNGKTHELGKDIIPVAVSNGARYIYYNKNESFYVQRGFNANNKEKLGEYVSALHANRDLTQIIYNTGSKAYVSKNGGAKEALSGSIGYLITPNTATAVSLPNVIVYGVSSFADTYYRSDDDAIIHINNKYETGSLAKNISNAFLADDGNTVTYLRNKSIYVVSGKGSNTEPIQIVDGNVRNFVATSDGKAVYFVNDDSEIYYQKGSMKPALVTNDYSYRGYGAGFTLFKGKTLYYITDEVMYSSSGAKGKPISGFNVDVQSISNDTVCLYVSTRDGSDAYYYRSFDGKKFELLK